MRPAIVLRVVVHIAALLTLTVLSPLPIAGAADPPALVWEQWQHLEGAVDVAGPRSDGLLVAMAAGRLYLVSADGTIAPFAAGQDGYAGPADAEPYFVVAPSSPALPASAAGCAFAPDDLFILDLSGPQGIVRVDATGHASRFATISNADWLYGIAFDTVGRFGYRLLASGTRGDHTVVVAVDCRGTVTTITEAAPNVEGGYAVAPASFGAYGGDLIAPDELTGQLWATGPDGTSRLVAIPDLPSGGDTGVESAGFVPPGFGAASANDAAYVADRGTPENPFPGTDSILRLSSQALLAAGVQEGDLLVATEGGGRTVAVRCDAAGCGSFLVADGPAGNTGHIEGHVIMVASR
jgi:hypothetical protein